MSTSIPDPPPGYQEPDEYEEAGTLKRTFLTSTGVANLLLTVVLFVGVVRLIPIDAELVAGVIGSMSGNSALSAIVLVFGGFSIIAFGTVILHEHVHKAVMKYFGYSAEINYGVPISYALIEEQMIERNHNLISLISPLMVISSVSLGASYLIPNQLFTVLFAGIFVVNTVSASGDIQGFITLFRRPSGTVIYHTHENGIPRSFIYEPE
ncbi:DUF3267 domain-containing protein [Halorubrum sp. GN12_10-3_MGM]|uniref:DUF3267 domain-containing protein n=1 Tax=Halorubrum sp. GN12_10-3_MGM TaxID=2518113 RepID=UPI0010F992CB|nr:DUF3267 domain-containing protein [Halorubrum sp. GN12_10-3_MGM]TKX64798.1 DUF3267 domain-containing protein [Halorubrum sp. GN12_10-3_MGM]